MTSFHPDVRLRLKNISVHLGYDLSVRVQTACALIGVDGAPLGYDHGHTHRLAPGDWAQMTLAQAVEGAFRAHHDHLGLHPPTPLGAHTPIHFHPHGMPDQPITPVLDGDPPTPEEHLARTIAYVTAAKQDELNAGRRPGTPAIALDPTQHPASPRSAMAVVAAPPDPLIDIEIVPQRPPLGLFARPHEEV